MRKFLNLVLILVLLLGIGTVKLRTVNATSLSITQLPLNSLSETSIKVVNDTKKMKAEVEETTRKEKQRNIDQTCYFNPDNVTEISNISIERIYQLLEGTSFQNWDCAQVIYDGERRDVPVNALFIISIARQESGHGYSNYAIELNNITSYKLNPTTYRSFSSKAECLQSTINLLSKEYLRSNGQWYNGISVFDVNENYFPGKNTWGSDVIKMSKYIKEKYPYKDI